MRVTSFLGEVPTLKRERNLNNWSCLTSLAQRPTHLACSGMLGGWPCRGQGSLPEGGTKGESPVGGARKSPDLFWQGLCTQKGGFFIWSQPYLGNRKPKFQGWLRSA